MNKFFILTLCCLSLVVHAEEKKVYKTVDKHGNVTFSDVPAKESEEVTVPPTPTFRTPDYSSMLPKESKQTKQQGYEKLAITSPAHDQVFWNVEANSITVVTSLEPSLKAGHKLVIKLDGKPVAGNTLSNLYRGSYVLTAEAQNAEGEAIIVSEPVSIHIKRAIIKKKPEPAKPETPTNNN